MKEGYCMVCGEKINEDDIHTIPFSASYKGLGSFHGIIHGMCAKGLQTEREAEAFRRSEVVRLYNERCGEKRVKKVGTREEYEAKEARAAERELKRKFKSFLAKTAGEEYDKKEKFQRCEERR